MLTQLKGAIERQLERHIGFEPMTLRLETFCSTTELMSLGEPRRIRTAPSIAYEASALTYYAIGPDIKKGLVSNNPV